MNTPPLKKGTSATVELHPQLMADGRVATAVIIKEKFQVSRAGRVNRLGGAEVRLVDEPWDKERPAESSIKFPSDLCLRKPNTDVVVVGSAVQPKRARAPAVNVLVRVGPVEKHLRVFGLRVWYRGLTGLSLGSPAAFDEVPLRWELAYGGSDFRDPSRPLEEARNPAGRGLTREVDKLVGVPGPQIEDPRDLIRGSRSRPAPAGVGAIGRHWQPRRSYVGTMDEAWKRQRMPLPPKDFDDRFNLVATPELIAPAYLRGGERVEMDNLCEEGPLRFALPKLSFFVGARTDAGMIEHRPALDTVLLEPNLRTFELTWRSAVPLPKALARLEYIQVHEKAWI